MIADAKRAGEEALAGSPEPPSIRVLFMDEARFGRISDTRRCWAPPGIRPTVVSQVVREYLYAYAAVCPFDGEMEAFVAPGVDADIMSLFLKQVSERYVDEHVVMILDQAGWHKAKRLKKPPNITLYWLPPYRPELNPVEHLWDDIREKWFHNRLFASIEGVEDQLVDALATLIGSPSLVRSLTLFTWMGN